MDLIDQVMEEFSQAFTSGKWAVDLMPAFQYLPEWFPGTGWKQTAKLWKKNMTQAIQIPFEYARLHDNSDNDPSFVSKAFSQYDENKGSLSQNETDMIKLAAVSLYTGGTWNGLYSIGLNH